MLLTAIPVIYRMIIRLYKLKQYYPRGLLSVKISLMKCYLPRELYFLLSISVLLHKLSVMFYQWYQIY